MHNEGPNEHVEEMKFCSIMQHDVKGYGTIRPESNNKHWGLKALKSTADGGEGYGDYLQINSFTVTGLDKIAQYNNYKEEWNVQKCLL